MIAKLIVAASLAFAGAAVSAQTISLIKDDEAKLPSGTMVATRAITRGPSIKLVSAENVQGKGFPIKFAFEARGGAQVDVASVKVEYLKTPLVDLTDRVKPGIKADGIELASVQVPPGNHPIRVTVRDSEGRQGVTVVTLTAQ